MRHAAPLLAVLFFALAWGAPAAAQQPDAAGTRPGDLREDVEAIVSESGIVPALEQVAAVAGPELEQAVSQLGLTLAALATRVAEDPEVRTSAARAARGIADVAAAVLLEQADRLQEALRTAADRIEAAGSRPPPN